MIVWGGFFGEGERRAWFKIRLKKGGPVCYQK